MTRATSAGLLLAALALTPLLSACHDTHQPATKVAPDSVAMARGKVDVEGGLLDILGPENGLVTEVLVHTGDHVRRGQPLAQLDRQSADVAVALAGSAIEQAKAQYALQQSRLPAAEQEAKRWQEAARIGAADQQRADSAQQASAQIAAEMAVAKTAIAVEQDHLSLAQQSLDKRTIRAPQDAEVVKVLIQPGSTLTIDKRNAFTLLPKTPLLIRAEVNESFIGRIKVGMTATVTPEYSTSVVPLKARVSQVGQVFEPSRLGNDATPQISRVVECLLVLDVPANLRIGQNVLVKFHD